MNAMNKTIHVSKSVMRVIVSWITNSYFTE